MEVTVSVSNWPAAPSQAAPAPMPPPEPAPAAGLSPFSARVLDQLSLTAWLPAALVVANTYLVIGMYMLRGEGDKRSIDNLQSTVSALDKKPIGVILAVLFGIVLVTLVTQSLEFAAIRFLEGYWGGSIFAAIPTWIGVRLQQTTLHLMDRRASKLERKAFAAAAPQISEELSDTPQLASAVLLVGCDQATAHLESDADGRDLLAQAQSYCLEAQWLEFSPAHMRHRVNSLYVKRKAFPSDPSRLMPTRLGNALRAFEDRLQGDAAGAKLRGYLYQRLDAIAPTLMRQHTQHRNRLDLYAVMSVVAALLAALDAWLLPAVLPRDVAASAIAVLVALSFVSYRGAIAAAMDYGPILLAMDNASTKQSTRATPTLPSTASS